tara:strand:+ start:101 stop:919 length:819 start_codon:yes stop_codon:yes gene_type:complete
MATIPYGFPQEYWPTISYFSRRFPENFHDFKFDASFYTFTAFTTGLQKHFGVFCFIFFCFAYFMFDFYIQMYFFCEWIFQLFTKLLFFCFFLICVFVIGYPFGCRFRKAFFLFFLNYSPQFMQINVGLFYQKFISTNLNFLYQDKYSYAVRFKSAAILVIFFLYDVLKFLFWDFVSPPAQFYSVNFIQLRRLLSSTAIYPHSKKQNRKHPRYGDEYERHVRITRQMRFQIQKFLTTYQIHFEDLKEFLENNEEHFQSLEQIYLNGVGAPMWT